MQRVYAPAGVVDGAIVLDRDEAHHLSRVRRVGADEPVVAFDGLGEAWLCRLIEAGRHGATLQVIEPVRPEESPAMPEVHLGTAVPKGDRFDWIVEKATELGVDRLVPLVCERSVVEPRATKLDRLRRSVVEACKQSGRNVLMDIADPVPLQAFLALAGADDIGLFADRGPGTLASVMASKPGPARVLVAIGPEGGWTDAEREAARNEGWRPISLGPHILRVETAAVAAAAVIWRAFSAGTGESRGRIETS